MTYLYEQLGPERFQELCQAVLIRDYPDLQCFPVGQPDGGRDAVSGASTRSVKRVVVQVKYKRNTSGDEAKWMIKALVKELPKIENLIARGAQEYIMVTNASGTAHPDGGRIDLVQNWLDQNVTIPARCLWRGDLDRRVEGSASDIKLAYPSILTGADALALLVDAVLGPARERIARTVRAFTAEQFRQDEEVKFRQVELANSLLALFVDVPVEVSPLLWGKLARGVPRATRESIHRLASIRGYPVPSVDEEVDHSGPAFTTNAADLLLDSSVQRGVPWVTLQGAPGQGKSTLAQYVCQVHRARYLAKTAFIAQLPEQHLDTGFRLPIKIDLRDLASYLQGEPYLGRTTSDEVGLRSFERFVASVVSIQSGGHDFSADDLLVLGAGVPLLLFLDGLDEVADFELRTRLVDTIGQGLNRLKESSVETQVVVTSRPTLFGQAPKFGTSFKKLELAPITVQTVLDYSNKWVLARRLEPDHAAEVRSILAQKLKVNHIRELTKNPMQLSILLSLISSIGHSLPDVRTDLYRQYVNLFMTREAEKSEVVRDHRSLLSEIVEYLAWLLQSGAETDRSSGSISEEELRRLVRDYLEAGKYDPDLVDDLFTGGIERVWVLVQRVEGLYEFEVQPLREYFAAKYLYSTAPSSFRYQEVHGDRADRFEAIASNPYWANVTRFYAGFYEPGEIGALSTSLREMIASKDAGLSLLARSVGASLLADWIFKSKKSIQEDLIEKVFDSAGLYLATNARMYGNTNVTLDVQCGRDHLAALIFGKYISGLPEVSFSVARFLRRNGGETLGTEFLAWISGSNGEERTRRIRLAAASGGLGNLSGEALVELVLGDDPGTKSVAERVKPTLSNEPLVIDRSEELSRMALNTILDWGGVNALASASDLSRLAFILAGDPFHTRDDVDAEYLPNHTTPNTSLRSLRAVLVRVDELRGSSSREVNVWEDPTYWVAITELMRAEFGERWAFYRLAIFNSGLLRAGYQLAKPGSVDDASTSLFERALIGRSWRGRRGWWAERVGGAGTGMERLFWIAMMFSWAPSAHIIHNLELAREIIDGLDESDFARLVEVLKQSSRVRRSRGGGPRKPVPLSSQSSERLGLALVVALGDAQLDHLTEDQRQTETFVRLLERRAVEVELEGFPGWEALRGRGATRWLSTLEKAKTLRAVPRRESRSALISVPDGNIPAPVAALVTSRPESYPQYVTHLAYRSLLGTHGSVPVRTIAERDKWSFG